MVMAREKALEGCPLAVTCSSQQWMHHPRARAVVPPAQEAAEVQSSSWAWKENASAVLMTATSQWKHHLIFYLQVIQNLGAHL